MAKKIWIGEYFSVADSWQNFLLDVARKNNVVLEFERRNGSPDECQNLKGKNKNGDDR